MSSKPPSIRDQLAAVHTELILCTVCPQMKGPAVHGASIDTKVMLIGQAPGPREGALGRPFAWTAGKTLFQWFHAALGMSEAEVRDRIYISATARCFPGKAPSGGDRRPNPSEILACSRHLKREVEILQPDLIIPVGTLAIEQVLKRKALLTEIIGKSFRSTFHGVEADIIALPHPSGVSTWHRSQPGRDLLHAALLLIASHRALAKP